MSKGKVRPRPIKEDCDAVAKGNFADCEGSKEIWGIQKTSMTGLRECWDACFGGGLDADGGFGLGG